MAKTDESSELTDQQELFCQVYAKFPNASKAYRKAYPDCSVAAAPAASSRLLTNVKILKRINEIKDDIVRNSKVTREQVVAELAEMGFSNLDISDLSPRDRIKALEALAKTLGFLHDPGNGKTNTDEHDRELSEAVGTFGKLVSGRKAKS